MDDFFTVASVATLSGSVAAVVFIYNTFRHVFNWGPRWFGLALSILISVAAFKIATGLGDTQKTTPLGWASYLIVFINGCLIYSSAFGIQNTLVSGPASKPPPQPPMNFESYENHKKEVPELQKQKLTFTSPW